MKNEAEFNRVVCRSINKEGFARKIADTVSYTSKRHSDLPFDIFGIYGGHPVYIESKFLKEPKAFNLSRLENHQLDALLKCRKLCPDARCYLLIGVVFGRGDIRVFYFDDLDEIKRRKDSHQSILKKEFLSNDRFVSVKKGLIDLSFIK